MTAAQGRVADAEWRVTAAAQEEIAARSAADVQVAERRQWQAAVYAEEWRYGTRSRATQLGLEDAEWRERNALREVRRRTNEHGAAQRRLADAERENTAAVWAAEGPRQVYEEAWRAEEEARLASQDALRAVDAARREADRHAAEAQASLEATLETTPMVDEYVGEDRPGYLREMHPDGVRYLTPFEREAYRIEVGVDGLLYDSGGNLYHIPGARRVELFVVDQHGRIYAGRTVAGRFHHASFLAGGDVAAAGEWRVFHGRIMYISDDSGHYRPQRRFLRQFIALLRLKGVWIADADIEYISSN